MQLSIDANGSKSVSSKCCRLLKLQLSFVGWVHTHEEAGRDQFHVISSLHPSSMTRITQLANSKKKDTAEENGRDQKEND